VENNSKDLQMEKSHN